MATSNPAFICPACGYFCEASWADIELEDALTTLPYFTGVIQMAAARQSPLMTLCLHPDGTGSYEGAETSHLTGRKQPRSLTPAEAEALLESAVPLNEIVPERVLEDAVLQLMGGLLSENDLVYVDPQSHPDDFARLSDGLHTLPETSPLARFYEEDDASLRGLQNHVLALLMGEEAVRKALEDAVYADQRTIFTPDELQALIDATRP